MDANTHAKVASPVQLPQPQLLLELLQLFLLLLRSMKSNGANVELIINVREPKYTNLQHTSFAYGLPFWFSLLLVHALAFFRHSFFGHNELPIIRLFSHSGHYYLLFFRLLTMYIFAIVTFADLDFVYACMHAFDRHKMEFKNIKRL